MFHVIKIHITSTSKIIIMRPNGCRSWKSTFLELIIRSTLIPALSSGLKKSIEYKHVQMVISSESDLKVPELIGELQSSGHIIDVECNTSKSSGILFS